MTGFVVHQIAPGASLQDTGRCGGLSMGLSQSGAADELALAEGAALLQQSTSCAALELPGAGGRFTAQTDLRIALTGAPMAASCDGTALRWNASHLIPKGADLTIGAARAGTYGYLHVGGGFDGPQLLGSRSAHLAVGLFGAVAEGQMLSCLPDKGKTVGLGLDVADRFSGGTLRVLPSLHTQQFGADLLSRFTQTQFIRDPRASRMGAKLNSAGPGFLPAGGLSVLSEVVVPGDIQITGDGTPYLLMRECQTTGGYPRIAAVLPCDLPRAAQLPMGGAVRFEFVSLDQALSLHAADRAHRKGLAAKAKPLLRDPHDIPDLLSYQLISGVTAGDED